MLHAVETSPPCPFRLGALQALLDCAEGASDASPGGGTLSARQAIQARSCAALQAMVTHVQDWCRMSTTDIATHCSSCRHVIDSREP